MSRMILIGSALAALAVCATGALASGNLTITATSHGGRDSVMVSGDALSDSEREAIRAEVRRGLHQARAGMLVAADAERAAAAAIAAAAPAIAHARVQIAQAVRAQTRATLAVAAAASVRAAPPAPAAAHSAPTPAAPAAPGLPPPLRTAPKTFNAASIDVHDVYGTLRVDVAPGPITVVLTARKEVLDRVTFRVDDGVLHIAEHSGVDGSWDIFRWLGYGDHGRIDRLDVHVRAPKGTPLDVDSLVGNIAVGDLEAPVKLELAATSGTIGSVTRAKIDMAGGGKLRVTRVSGTLALEVAGSGQFVAGPVGASDVEIAGSGSASLGAIAGGLKATIAGSGDVAAASVNGPTHIEIAGSGSVKVAGGVANPLKLAIMGSGDFDFGGEAVNPNVEVLGSGKVRIRSYRGNLTTEGTANVQVGAR